MDGPGIAGARRARSRGWYIPWIFVGMFLVVVVANAVLILLAVNTFPGLSSDRAFEEGVAYNRALAGAAVQQARGWQVEPVWQDHGHRTGELAVAVRGKDGQPLGGAEVSAEFRRPTVGGHDFKQVLGAIGPGRYAAPVNAPIAGIWDVRITVRRADGDHQSVTRVTVLD